MRGRIKRGAMVLHDRVLGRWPSCCPPSSEYDGEQYRYEAKDPGMVFDVARNGRRWECRADGYGMFRSRGEAGEYGNGSVFVIDGDGVELIA